MAPVACCSWRRWAAQPRRASDRLRLRFVRAVETVVHENVPVPSIANDVDLRLHVRIVLSNAHV